MRERSSCQGGQQTRGVQVIKLSRLRERIAQVTTQSVREIPAFQANVEIDMSAVVELRQAIEADIGRRLSYQVFILKAIAMALKDAPSLNSTFRNGELRIYQKVNLGLVIAIEDGLLIPVIHDVGPLSLGKLADEARRLTTIAKTGKLPLKDMSGGTFTVSNLGALGVDSFNAVIFPPQTCILAVGAMRPRPVVVEDEITAHPTIQMTLSADHRVIDGAAVAKFFTQLKEILENASFPERR